MVAEPRQVAAGTPGAHTLRAGAHTLRAGAHTLRAGAHTLRAGAAHMAPVPRRSLARGRRRRRAGLAAARRNRVAGHRPWARPWLRMDSCLRVSRSARDQPGVPGQSHPDRRGAGCSKPAQAAERSRDSGELEAVARLAIARAVAARRTAAEPAATVPKPARVGAAAAAARGEARRDREGALPRRPKGCRRTGKTCWWAGSRRRTACTRSCEKLPSSSYAPLTCVAKRREHTCFTASLRS
jgi:X-X-X-Leu-X-X-Gly heptad repeat protein